MVRCTVEGWRSNLDYTGVVHVHDTLTVRRLNVTFRTEGRSPIGEVASLLITHNYYYPIHYRINFPGKLTLEKHLKLVVRFVYDS